MRSRSLLVGALAALLSGVSLPAAAQVAGGGDVTAGYVLATNPDIAVNASNLPGGWYTSGQVRLTEGLAFSWTASGAFRFGIPASSSTDLVVLPGQREEFQGLSYHRPETLWCSPTTNENVEECDVNIQSVVAGLGPRYTFNTGGRARGFVQLHAGFARALRNIDFYTHTGTNFAIIPGAGVDIDVSETYGLRIQADYLRAFVPQPASSRSSLRIVDGKDFNEIRIGIGVIIKISAWNF